MELQDALRARRSIRAFSGEPVSEATLRHIFAASQQAPSWCNIQPWRVVVTAGAKTKELALALSLAAQEGAPAPDYSFPAEYPEPYRAFRTACGKALYGAMGIERSDTEARQDAWMRNYRAFDAPHIAIVSVHRSFGHYGVLDVGCWLQSVMLCATECGVATCAQASLASYPRVARRLLPIDDTLAVLCGIAVGYEAVEAPANRCRTTRADLDSNVVFVRE